MSSQTQVSYTLKKIRVLISRSIQNGWAFKMVVVLTGCTIAIDHAFNCKYSGISFTNSDFIILVSYLTPLLEGSYAPITDHSKTTPYTLASKSLTWNINT